MQSFSSLQAVAAMAVVMVASLALLAALWTRHAVLRREAFVRRCELPRGLFDRLRAKHPQMSAKDCQLVAHGLRQFFLAHLKSGRRFVCMPSQFADDLWHEFILSTKSYEAFCEGAFGRFLHPTPAVALGGDRRRNEGLRRWWFACKEENIDPGKPTRLPLLFALDAKLRIAGGFRYVPDCSGVRRVVGDAGSPSAYCGGDFASDSFDGGTAGFGDGSSDSAGGDGGGGGCGGGGCGGGGGD